MAYAFTRRATNQVIDASHINELQIAVEDMSTNGAVPMENSSSVALALVNGTLSANAIFGTTAGTVAEGSALATNITAFREETLARANNLVVNDSGQLGSNYNFSIATFNPLDSPNGLASFSTSARLYGPITDQLIPVDMTKTYINSIWMRTASEQTIENRIYAGFAPYDIDKLAIAPDYVAYRAGSETRLAQPLNPGDTTVVVENASGWHNSGDPNTPTHYHSIVVYGYTNSFGYTYPDYTYSRYMHHTAYVAGAINTTTNTITLSKPWPASFGSHPIGSAIANAHSGGTFKYSTAINALLPKTWTRYSGKISGMDLGGVITENKFYHGTAFVRPIVLSNMKLEAGVVTAFSGVSWVEDTFGVEDHKSRIDNPHAVTKTQVGLANVPNVDATSRANHTGTQIASTISDFSTAADARISAQKGVANGLATLGSDSRIPSSQVPPIAMTDIHVVASEAAQIALSAQEGDVAIRSDLSRTYIHNGGVAGSMADWTEMATPTDAVLSVNGETGSVVIDKTDLGLGTEFIRIDLAEELNLDRSGATNVSATLQSYFTANGGGRYYLPDGTYRFDTVVDLPDGTDLEFAKHARITRPTTATGAALQSLGSIGTPIALTADATSGASSVTVASTTGLVVGDWVKISNSKTPYADLITKPYREVQRVKSITGVGPYTITFSGRLAHNHAVVDAAEIAPINAKTIRVTGLAIQVSPADTAGNHGIHLRYNIGSQIEVREISGWRNHAVSVEASALCHITGVDGGVIRDPYTTVNQGYAVAFFEGSCYNRVQGITGIATRHDILFTTGSSYNIAHDCLSFDNPSRAFDCHGAEANFNLFSRCKAFGASGQGFGIGNTSYGGDFHNTFIDCEYWYGTSQAFYVGSGSHNNRIINAKVRGATRGAFVVDSNDVQIINPDISNASEYGIHAYTTSRIKVVTPRIVNSSLYGVRLDASPDALIDSPNIEGGPSHAIYLVNGSHRASIISPIIRSPGGTGVLCDVCEDVKIMGGGRIENAGSIGIYIRAGSHRSRVDGITILGGTNTGVYVGDSNGVQVNADTRNTAFNGIRFHNSNDGVIGGSVRGTQGLYDGIYISGTSQRVTVLPGTVSTENGGIGVRNYDTTDYLRVVGVNAAGNLHANYDIYIPVGTNNEINGNLGRYTPVGDTINRLAQKSDVTHIHDDRYYTETEVDTNITTAKNNTQLYTQSRGENLVTNGNGFLKNNQNFTGFTFDPTIRAGGFGAFSITSAYTTKFSDEPIPVDPTLTYELVTYAKTPPESAGSQIYLGIAGFDADGLAISASHHMFISGSETELTQPLTSGDTVMHVASLNNWLDPATSLSHQKQIPFYNYVDSSGYLFPPYGYTRNVLTSAQGISTIDRVNNTITLAAPYGGQYGTIPAGTKTANGSSGGTYKYIAAANSTINTEWQRFSGQIGGVDYTGQNQTYMFPPGLSAVKVLFLVNKQGSTLTTTNTQYYADVSFTNMTKKNLALENVNNTSDLAKPISTATQTALNGKANTTHTHATGDITSGIFAIGRIPTGTTNTTVALGDHTHSNYALASRSARVYYVESTTRAAIQAKIDEAGTAGGGVVFVPNGTYDIDDANADIVGLGFFQPNVVLVGESRDGVILRLGNGANAHLLQMSADGCGVFNLTLDGNRVNQTVQSHCIAVNANYLHYQNLRIINAPHYGMGVGQATGSAIKHLVARDIIFSGSGGDAIDFKNKVSGAAYNTLENITVESFGLNLALGAQAGIDIRGPVNLSNIVVEGVIDDGVGIRFRQGEVGETHGAGGHGSNLNNFRIVGDGTSTATQAVNSIARNVKISNGEIIDVRAGVMIQEKHNVVSNVNVTRSYYEAFRTATGSGYNGDYAVFDNCSAIDTTGRGWRIVSANTRLSFPTAMNGTTWAIQIDPTADNTAILGAKLSGNVGNITDAGTNTSIITMDNGVVSANKSVAAPTVKADNVDINPQGSVNLPMSDPAVAPTLTASTTGGSLATGTYYYRVVGVDKEGGLTLPGPEASVAVTGPTGSVTVAYTNTPGAVSYRVYRGTAAGGQNTWFLGADDETFTDTGQAGTAGTPPTSSTAYSTRIRQGGDGWITAKSLIVQDGGTTIDTGTSGGANLTLSRNNTSSSNNIAIKNTHPGGRGNISWYDEFGNPVAYMSAHGVNDPGHLAGTPFHIEWYTSKADLTTMIPRFDIDAGQDIAQISFMNSTMIGISPSADVTTTQFLRKVGAETAATELSEFLRPRTSSIGSNYFFRNLPLEETAGPIVHVLQAHATDDQTMIKVRQYGTGNYVEYQRADATSIWRLLNNTRVGHGLTVPPSAQYHVRTHANTVPAIIAQATSTQSANIQEWQDSAGAKLATIGPTGNVSAGSELYLNSTTANKHINVQRTTGENHQIFSFDTGNNIVINRSSLDALLPSGTIFIIGDSKTYDIRSQTNASQWNLVPKSNAIIHRDGLNLFFGTTTGTMIGTASTQKLAFFGATPIVQPAAIASPTGGTTVDTEARAALNAVLAALRAEGLIAP